MSPPITLPGVVSQSINTIATHSLHFIALSVLFLVPLSFLITVFSPLHALFETLTLGFLDPSSDSITIPLIFAAISILLFTLAFGSITSSVVRAVSGQSVSLRAAVRHALRSFARLLCCAFIFGYYQWMIYMAAFIIYLYSLRLFAKLGFGNGPDDVITNFSLQWYTIGPAIVIGCVAVWFLMQSQVDWALGGVVTVVEGRWGRCTLWKSKALVKWIKGVTFQLLLIFWLCFGLFAVVVPKYDSDLSFVNGSWVDVLEFVVRIVGLTILMAMCILVGVVANSVLYLYGKELNGGLEGDIAAEFGESYVSLSFHQEKGPYVSLLAGDLIRVGMIDAPV